MMKGADNVKVVRARQFWQKAAIKNAAAETEMAEVAGLMAGTTAPDGSTAGSGTTFLSEPTGGWAASDEALAAIFDRSRLERIKLAKPLVPKPSPAQFESINLM